MICCTKCRIYKPDSTEKRSLNTEFGVSFLTEFQVTTIDTDPNQSQRKRSQSAHEEEEEEEKSRVGCVWQKKYQATRATGHLPQHTWIRERHVVLIKMRDWRSPRTYSPAGISAHTFRIIESSELPSGPDINSSFLRRAKRFLEINTTPSLSHLVSRFELTSACASDPMTTMTTTQAKKVVPLRTREWSASRKSRCLDVFRGWIFLIRRSIDLIPKSRRN